MVKPILLYGSEIWGFSKNIQCLEKVQLRFCKLLLKLKTSTPSYMIYGELGLLLISKYCNIHRIYSKYFVNHRGFQPVGQYRQHIKVQTALNKYSTRKPIKYI
jgi:hypothetical protein